MGMYTELHFNAELVNPLPPDVLHVLEYMLGNTEEAHAELPEHPLFGDTRWRFMLRCDSYYFAADTHSTLRYDDIGNCYYLCIRSNLKNYSSEIENFIDWIQPYLAEGEGNFLGFYRYEETEVPTLIYSKKNNASAQLP